MAEKNDPVADDIAARNPGTDDQVAGEEVLSDDPSAEEPRVAPEPDDLRDDPHDDEVEETDRDRSERHD